MYLSLDTGHGHPVDVGATVAAFMRWRHPGVEYSGWQAGTLVSGDMRGR